MTQWNQGISDHGIDLSLPDTVPQELIQNVM